MNIASLKVSIGADLTGLEKGVAQASRSLQSFAKNMTAVGAGMSKALTAPILGFATASVFAFDKQAKAVAQVEQAILSTGGAAKKTSKDLQLMASALQENSLFGDEEILTKVTAQLLTFTNIAGREFDRTQQAALDLATRLGGDLQSASIQLGKALNDPIANLSALSRSGIQFSDTQKALINTLAETGRLAEAQTVILDELEKQYGGSAKAAAEAGAGGITQLKNSFGDLMEQIGEVVVEAITPFVNTLRDIVKALQQTDREMLKFYVTIGAIVAAIGPLLIGMGLFIKSLTTINALLLVTFKNPYILVAAGVIALTGYYAKLFYQAKKTQDLLKQPFDSEAPMDEQIQRSIKVVEALDKRVTQMRKNLGVGVTTESGLEAQQRQLQVVEYRLSVERQLLADLILQSKEIQKQGDLTGDLVTQTQKVSASYQSISAIIEDNKKIIDSILDTTAKVSDEDLNRAKQLVSVNNALQSELTLRQNIVELQARGVDTSVGRVVELPDFGPLQQSIVDAERYANSMQALGSKINTVKVETIDLTQVNEGMSASVQFLSSIADTFTASFGQGMANVVVQGEKLTDVLRNIGRLLLSSAIQKGLSVLLTGGLSAAGTGFFGSGGGLFGRLFGSATSVNDALITSNGNIVKFHPDDNILAMKDFGNLSSSIGRTQSGNMSVDVRVADIVLRGSDIVLAFENSKRYVG
jgi:hypothetical protein